MKILIQIIILLLAFGQALKAQENEKKAPIDFWEFIKIVTPKMCDSIYKVDTLYYPFEGDVQIIELRLKTVFKKEFYFNQQIDYSHSFSIMPSIFIFRDRNGNFKSIYNQHINFIIDSRDFRATNFINSKPFPDDYIIVEKLDSPSFIDKQTEELIFTPTLKQGLINHQGKIVVPIQYKDINIFKESASILLYENLEYNDKIPAIYHFIDYYTLHPINNQYDIYKIDTFRNLPYCIAYTTTESFFIDKRGNNILPKINYGRKFNDMFIIINKKNKWGILNKELKFITPPIYSWISPEIFEDIDNKYIIPTRKKGKAGLIDLNKNKTLIDFKYDEIEIFSFFITKKRVFLVYKDNKVGLYNHNYKLVIPIEYEKIIVRSNHIQVKKEGKWGIINADFEIFLAPEFNNIIPHIGAHELQKDPGSLLLYGLNNKELKTMPIKNNTYYHQNIMYDSFDEEGNIIFKIDYYYNINNAPIIKLMEEDL